ncbi:MAG: flagellar protein FlgN [Sedimenticola sp.]
MSLTADQQQTLTNLLNAEVTTARQLKQLLEKEYEALTAGNPEQILAVTQEKDAALQQMLQHDRERNRFLGTLPVAAAAGELGKILDTLSPESAASSAWHELQGLAEALHQQNTINGGMVAIGQRHTRQALDILSGRTHDGDTYGPEGEQRQGASTDPLGKA